MCCSLRNALCGSICTGCRSFRKKERILRVLQSLFFCVLFFLVTALHGGSRPNVSKRKHSDIAIFKICGGSASPAINRSPRFRESNSWLAWQILNNPRPRAVSEFFAERDIITLKLLGCFGTFRSALDFYRYGSVDLGCRTLCREFFRLSVSARIRFRLNSPESQLLSISLSLKSEY